MFQRLATGLITAATLATATPLLAQETLTADTVVATVNGTDITLGHMIMIRASLPEQYQQLPDDVLFTGILDQLIQQQALNNDPLATETRRVETAMANERRSLMASEVIRQIIMRDVTEAAVEALYAERYATAGEDAPLEYNASHILVETEEEAQRLSDEANTGVDFAELAREHSTGPSGPNGGALGWFAEGMMVPSFQEAVAAMAVGEVSDPVQTQFGWHVIRLNETRQQSAPEFEEVRDTLRGELEQQVVEGYIAAAAENAAVTRINPDDIDMSAISNVDLLDD
ncbi:peptidylprolyl isomerase [Cognatishimia sp. F0-27]|uniref:peptidylprolyl isomerase n=1 Tax=Cognatishimia sp. F0-27 TaxID=2816855 RepID=UPI001D0BFF83|nr:peptidylprolyl isomerase [Cognatishimia sp. F0-27]MCC1491274.1 peptidylprolyl isomerase [Cognatishimia sp. F0-27]